MTRGTNPVHAFRLPFDVSVIKSVKIIYAQRGQKVCEKHTADCTMDGNVVTVRLSQEDTIAMDSDFPVSIQMRVLTEDDDSLVSRVMNKPLWELLDDEVIT